MRNTLAMQSIPTKAVIAVMAATFFSAAASADSGGFFFDSATPTAPKQRATFSAEQRDRILKDAYACNRVGQSPDERERCRTREMAAEQAILERTMANHQAANPQRREMQRLYERMSPMQR